MRCFVTVGSTEFDALIAAIIEPKCLESLRKIGITDLLLQIGRGKIKLEEGSYCGVNINFYRYKDNILCDIAEADLVIGHAGSGTCLEVLRLRKPLVVVINEELMDNHQRELAERFAERGYIVSTLPTSLAKILGSPNIFNRKPFVEPNYDKLANIIIHHMGIV